MASAAKRRQAKSAGAPEWIVTFADLMSILVCFFVLIISFSIQDEKKLQVVAGSMREAFGVRIDSMKSGVIEVEGAPLRDHIRHVAPVPEKEDSDFATERHDQNSKQGPEANTHDIEQARSETPRQFTTAAESLRQAWKQMPEIMEISDQIIMEEVPEGLNIQLVDHDGRSMFAPGSKHPYERTRVVLAKMAQALRDLPNRVVVTGHTSSDRSEEQPGYSNWDLSADRANAVRAVLMAHGVSGDRFAAVSGKADAEPLFPEDTYLAANRRISILLMSEEPPLPAGHHP